MTCSRWEKMVALYTGGDLADTKAHRVERHIAGCASCRELAESLSADRAVLARLDAGAAEDIELGSVRGAVLEELAENRRAGAEALSWSRVALAAAAVVLVVLSVVVVEVFERRGARIAEVTPGVAERAEKPTLAVPGNDLATPSLPASDDPAFVSPSPRAEPFTRVARAGPPAVRPAAAGPSVPTEPMVMKILTDDPEVVIYWIVEAKGEENHV